MCKKVLVLSCFLMVSFCFYGFDSSFSYGKGPLSGKNIYSPFIIFMCLPGYRAAIEESGYLTVSSSLYYTQDFFVYKITHNSATDTYKAYRTVDYESCTFETSGFYSFNKHLEIGATLRIISYYGGVLDDFTQWWHSLGGFPNGGREYVADGDVFVNFETRNGFDITLDHTSVAFGDIDTWLKYNFFSNRYVDLALLGGFKLPTGQLAAVSGSGYPDLLSGILFDWYPVKYFSIYLQTAGVLPLQCIIPDAPKPYPMLQNSISFEVAPFSFFSIIAQMNIRTSPISGYFTYVNNIGVNAEYLSSPQTNLLVGCVMKVHDFRIQCYFEEDTFTNAGADYTVSLSVSSGIKLK